MWIASALARELDVAPGGTLEVVVRGARGARRFAARLPRGAGVVRREVERQALRDHRAQRVDAEHA